MYDKCDNIFSYFILCLNFFIHPFTRETPTTFTDTVHKVSYLEKQQ